MAYNYQPMPNYYGQQQPMYPNGNAAPDMLNQFKGQYQQQMQQMQMQPQPMPIQPINNDMIWVLGEVEAMSYPVAPNNTVTLWDKNDSTVYIKSVNAQGVPSMRVLDYAERTGEPKHEPKHECTCGQNFVHKDDFNKLKEEFEALQEKINRMVVTPAKKTTKKEAKETEVE